MSEEKTETPWLSRWSRVGWRMTLSQSDNDRFLSTAGGAERWSRRERVRNARWITETGGGSIEKSKITALSSTFVSQQCSSSLLRGVMYVNATLFASRDGFRLWSARRERRTIRSTKAFVSRPISQINIDGDGYRAIVKAPAERFN